MKLIEKRHPLVSVKVLGQGNRLIWHNSTPPSETVRWEDHLEPPTFAGLDLNDQSGLQLLFKATSDTFEIWGQAHQATFDGGAGIRLANEWMLAYDNLVNGRKMDQGLPRLRKKLLKNRNRLGMNSLGLSRQLLRLPFAVLGMGIALFRRFGLLTNAVIERSKPVVLHDTFPVVHGDWIEPDTVRSLNDQAVKHKVHVEAILLAQLYLTIRDWRTQHQFGRPDDWIRVVTPVSIRGMGDRYMPAANRSSTVQFDRRPEDFKRPDLLAKGLHRELKLIRRNNRDRLFLIAVRGMSVFHPWLRASAESNKFRGTIVFTNLGFPFSRNRKLRSGKEIRAGNLVLDDFDWVGPIHPGLGVNLTAQFHGDRIRISMHVDTRQIDLSDAYELFEKYRERLANIRI